MRINPIPGMVPSPSTKFTTSVVPDGPLNEGINKIPTRTVITPTSSEGLSAMGDSMESAEENILRHQMRALLNL